MLNPVVRIVTTGLKSRRSARFADLLGKVWPVGAATAVAASTDLETAITQMFLSESRDQSERQGLAN